jgi:hypothetical protein
MTAVKSLREVLLSKPELSSQLVGQSGALIVEGGGSLGRSERCGHGRKRGASWSSASTAGPVLLGRPLVVASPIILLQCLVELLNRELEVAARSDDTKEFRTRASGAHPFRRCMISPTGLSRRSQMGGSGPGWGALVRGIESSFQSPHCSAHLRLQVLALAHECFEGLASRRRTRPGVTLQNVLSTYCRSLRPFHT